MTYIIIRGVFLLLMVLAILLEKGKKISRITTIITVCILFFSIAVLYALQSEWIFCVFHAFLGSSLAIAEYRNQRIKRKLRKSRNELEKKLASFEKELQDYRSKREGVKVRDLLPAEQNTDRKAAYDGTQKGGVS